MIEHPSQLRLEQHLLGESNETMKAHIDGCPTCRERLRVMGADDRAFLTVHPNTASIGLAPVTRRKAGWWAAAVAFAAVGSIAIAMLQPPEPETRMKGSAHVDLLVRRGGQTVGFEGQSLRAGDTLMFRYTTMKRNMLIAGVEASGQVSIFVENAPLSPGQGLIASQGVQLDDYAGPERVILLLSETPLDVKEVRLRLEAYAKDGPDKTPMMMNDADMSSWLITKEVP